MSKAKDLRDALDEVDESEWQCRTCDSPSDGDDNYCRHCRMYWEDVSAGLFDRDEDWGTWTPQTTTS